MADEREGQDEEEQISTMDVAEHRAAPNLNPILSKEEKEKILLPDILTEGHVAIDIVLQLGMSIIEREDGALECLDWVFNRAVSGDGGRTWGEYRKVEDLYQPMESDREARVAGGWLRLPSGRIGMQWGESGLAPGGHLYNRLWWRLSEDEGKTWSEDIRINPTGELGRPYVGEPMRVTASGRLLLPLRMCYNAGQHIHDTIQLGEAWWKGEKVGIEGHGHWPEFDITYVYYSDDEGQTWSRCEGNVIGWLYRGWGNFVSTDEPGLEQLKDGRLLMLMRSTIGRLLQSFSEDEGEHWSLPEPSPLASSYAPCALKKIPQTGDLLCVWNQVSPDEIRQGKQRGRLSAATTSDGQTWQHFRTIERHGRMSEADRIEPEELLIICRSLDDVGDLPVDRGLSDYATIAFHGDEVIIAYANCKGVAHDLVSAMKIRVLPLDWFYDAP